MRKLVTWLVIATVAAALAVTGGTYVYINFIRDDAPAPLTLNGSTDQSFQTATNGSGNWQATSASQVGYRVKELLFGQDTEAVGRTNSVNGSLTINDKTVSAVDLSVDMASVTSDQTRRDGQFRGRIMEVAKYPTSTFKLTTPITLTDLPNTTAQTVSATGDLMIHGVTKSVTTDLRVARDGGTVKVQGAIPVKFSDYDIDNPSFAGVSTEDNGTLELLVVFAPKNVSR